MKTLWKILKWAGAVLLIFVAGISAITATRQHVRFDAVYPSIRASKDTSIIARGKHLVFDIAHCADCHSPQNADSLLKLGKEVPLSGGVKFGLPVGDIYSKNITPDKEYGIGKFSDGEIARALRYGVHPDGTAVYDFMPFHDMSDEDLTAIISFLRTQTPVANRVPENRLNVIGKVVKAFMVKPVGPSGTVPASVQPDTTAAYGKYLVTNLAGCKGCHTRRDMSGAFVGAPFGGGGPMDHGLVPPNITPDSSSRIFGWKQEDFIRRFRMGKLIPYSHMPWNSFKRMSTGELKAVYNYLQTVKPARTAGVQ